MGSTLAVGAVAAAGLAVLARRGKSFDLRSRTVLVTGGSRGLGFLLAREFLRQGARVAICARDAAELERAREALAAEGEVVALECDLRDPAQVSSLVRVVRQTVGPIDVLVNNAGTITVGPAELMTIEDYEDAMRTHFWAPLHMTLAALPDLRAARGRLVNVASIGGVISIPHLVPYCVSKFALVALSEGLHAELAKDAVRVTTIVPGLMRTGSPRNAWFKGRHRAEFAWFSIADALPLVSMDAERAARRIVAACRRGEVHVVLSAPAKAAATVHALFPALSAGLLALVNRVLPSPDGAGTRARMGRASASPISPSWLTRLSDRAARRFNEAA